jgi:hypothetical protein
MYSRITASSRPTVDKYPRVLPYEFTLAFPIDPSQVYGALPLDVTDHLPHCVLWRDRDHQMHVVRHNVTLFDPTFLLQRQPLKYLAEMLPQLCIQRFSPTLGNEYDVVAAHDSEFLRWTP